MIIQRHRIYKKWLSQNIKFTIIILFNLITTTFKNTFLLSVLIREISGKYHQLIYRQITYYRSKIIFRVKVNSPAFILYMYIPLLTSFPL